MQTFYAKSSRDKSPLEPRIENNIIKNFSLRKKIPVYIKNNASQFYPTRKYVKNCPFPYCSLKRCASNLYRFNQTEEEKQFPCHKKVEKLSFFPIITRQDLLKYFNKNCNWQNSLPVICGRSSDKKFKIVPKYKRPTLTRNFSSNLRNRLTNFSIDEKNMTLNVNKLHAIEESKNASHEECKNERYEECDKCKENANNKRNIKILSLDNLNNIFFQPKKKTNFRKVQIFNHFKPYLVDEFKDFGSYY